MRCGAVLVLIVLLFASVADAGGREWSKISVVTQVAATTLIVLDWGQTLSVPDSDGYYRETNGFLGPYPSRGQVNRYFGLVTLGQLAVSFALPDKYRPFWNAIWIGVEGNSVRRNHVFGARLNF